MLRMLKISSPMSVGSWALLIFSQCCATSVVRQASHDGLLGRFGPLVHAVDAVPSRVIGALGLLPALLFSGYTGALLSATAVPLWTKRYLLMGPLFMASAFSSATALLTLSLTLLRGANHHTLQRLEMLELSALWSELCLLLTLEKSLGATIARPLTTGRLGQVYRFGVLGCGIALPLALRGAGRRLGGRWTQAMGVVASLLALCGGFFLRYVMVMGGGLSADDPHATFEMTRSRS